MLPHGKDSAGGAVWEEGQQPPRAHLVRGGSPYHALLGRPTLAKFMAVPHCAYFKMKLPALAV
jgi:hypothetical protein